MPHCSWSKVMHLTTCTKLYCFCDQWEKYSYMLPLFIALPHNKASKHIIPGILSIAIISLVLGSSCCPAFDCLQYMQSWVVGRPGNEGNETHTFTSTVACMTVVLLLCVVLCTCPLYSLNDMSLQCRMKEGAVGNLNLASRGDQGCVMAVQKDQCQGTCTLTHNSITIVCGVAI